MTKSSFIVIRATQFSCWSESRMQSAIRSRGSCAFLRLIHVLFWLCCVCCCVVGVKSKIQVDDSTSRLEVVLTSSFPTERRGVDLILTGLSSLNCRNTVAALFLSKNKAKQQHDGHHRRSNHEMPSLFCGQ